VLKFGGVDVLIPPRKDEDKITEVLVVVSNF